MSEGKKKTHTSSKLLGSTIGFAAIRVSATFEVKSLNHSLSYGNQVKMLILIPTFISTEH